MCLFLGLVLFLGVGVFCYRYYTEGDDWASYEGNRDVYTKGDLSKGALYDANGLLLMQNTEGGTIYNENADIRCALMHITGDKDNNISTGANRAFTDELIGYDFVNGVYSLNNAGETLTTTLDANVCATAYRALAGERARWAFITTRRAKSSAWSALRHTIPPARLLPRRKEHISTGSHRPLLFPALFSSL